MKSLLLFFSVACMSVSSMADFKRVKPESEEKAKIATLIENINKNNGCKLEGRVQFDQWEDISGGCGGQWTKSYDKGGNPRIKVRNSKCTNIILGLEKTYNNSYKALTNGATRLYKAEQYETANIQVNNKAMEGDSDFFVVLTGNTGKSCHLLDARF